MTILKRIILLFTASATFWGCSTDLDINAPYKDIAVVYGLLNMRDTIHLVKLNKAYLGEGNAFTYAAIPDSNQYRAEDITVARIHRVVNGQRQQSFQLRDTVIGGRQPGTFFGPEQRFLYFRTGQSLGTIPEGSVFVPVYLDANAEYELELVVRGNSISGRAPIVNDISLFPTLSSPTAEIGMVSAVSGYGSYEVKWTSGRDSKRTSVAYRFNYTEVRGTDSTQKTISQVIGTRVSNNSQVAEPLSVILDGQLFFSNLRNKILNENDPAVTKRIFTGMDFVFSVANDDFHTFLTLSEPVTGIVEERPAYSNVENAYGVFASRYNKYVIGKRFNAATLNELINGQFTGTLRFCSAFNSGPPYGCN